jgi:hypothetical protein
MHQRLNWDEARGTDANDTPLRRGTERAIKLVTFQSEFFRPVITRAESRVWRTRRQRGSIMTATL